MNDVDILTEEEFDDDDVVYKLTPKSCFLLALKEAEFINDVMEDTVQTKLAWMVFQDLMTKNGYVKEEGNQC